MLIAKDLQTPRLSLPKHWRLVCTYCSDADTESPCLEVDNVFVLYLTWGRLRGVKRFLARESYAEV